MMDDRTHSEDGDMKGRGGVLHACAMAHRTQKDGSLHDPHPCTPIFFGDGDTDPALLGKGVVELPGELMPFIVFSPIFIVKGFSKAASFALNLFEFRPRREIQGAMVATRPSACSERSRPNPFRIAHPEPSLWLRLG